MWGTLISILEKKWSESRQPRKKLAKSLAALYGSMSACHQAFTNYKNTQTEEDSILWGQSIDSLILTFRNVQPVLKIFHTQAYDHLYSYLRSEDRVASLMFGDGGLAQLGMSALLRQIEEESHATNAYFPPDYDITKDDGEDFKKAINVLGEIIKKEFKMEEIFDYL